jgi:hypothetical protein
MASTIAAGTTSGTAIAIAGDTSGVLQLQTNGTTAAVTIDTSQNVGIGTSSPDYNLQVEGSGDRAIAITSTTSADCRIWLGDTAAPFNGAVIYRNDSDSLAFNTVATERMRIDSSGNVLVGKTSPTPATVGCEMRGNGIMTCTRSAGPPLTVNRTTDDGDLVAFSQDGTQEGSISVSGTTVSYNGGHLSRWSQLPDNSKDDTILKGTVLTNLDDMCVWVKDGETLPNEQLNKMQVSNVEGDTNVAGVFVNWTRDEDCNTDDMNVAMTGDMIIRIAEGVVVQKGDLLMSAGDGTAKPQGDDIRRSKTVAKVTSNHVTCTYADGSYCVPCVLMAC